MESVNRVKGKIETVIRSPMEQVLEFHEAFGLAIDAPFTEELIDLREKLHNEELEEVDAEFEVAWTDTTMSFRPNNINPKKLTKELADLLYVIYGTAVSFGLPLEEVFNEVHKSNMSKLGADNKPIYREDGKVLKGPNYKEPDLGKYFDSSF